MINAVDSLLTAGYAVIDEDASLVERSRQVLISSRNFFARPNHYKEACTTPSILEGYRAFGKEYSVSAERPDLSESFAFWLRNRSQKNSFGWSSSLDLYAKLDRLAEPIIQKTHDLLESIKAIFNPHAPAIEFRDMSYLQINYYEPERQDRDYLQDAHEDGHLVTLLKTTGPGLEIKSKGRFRPVEIAGNQMLVMPGSLLTIMTGGRIQPMYHRVRTCREVPARLSLMFFVNPALDKEIAPWINTEYNEGLDVRMAAIEKSASFGLPSLTQIKEAEL